MGSQKKMEWINARIDKKSICTVLDVGCGSGGYLTFPLILSNPEKDIFGIDIAEDSINYAKKCASMLGVDTNRFICSDITELDEKYDCVICL